MRHNYRIVSGITSTSLEETVLDLMEMGWKPDGGIVFVPETDETKQMYFQAMILEDDSGDTA